MLPDNLFLSDEDISEEPREPAPHSG